MFGATLWGCSPSRGPEGHSGESLCSGRLLEIVEPSCLGWQAASGPRMCEGKGEGRCTGKHSFLIAGRPVSSLRHGEYSMGAHPFFSPLPNTGALSLLQIQLLSQVPSDVAFHFPTLSILLPPHVTLCFLLSQAVSALSNLTDWFLGPLRSLCSTPSPSPFPGTNLWSQGLGAQPPPRHLNFW